jgi:hypothetical protein
MTKPMTFMSLYAANLFTKKMHMICLEIQHTVPGFKQKPPNIYIPPLFLDFFSNVASLATPSTAYLMLLYLHSSLARHHLRQNKLSDQLRPESRKLRFFSRKNN